MILLLIQDDKLAGALLKTLQSHQVPAERLDGKKTANLERLYHPQVSAVVVDRTLPGLPEGGSTDLLNALGRRVPVVVLENGSRPADYSDTVTVLGTPTVQAIESTLAASGVLNHHAPTVDEARVAYYNPHIPTRMLVANGGLAFLTIDASNFRKIEIEYGYEVYVKVKEVFRKLLVELKGGAGCFRAADVVCRKSEQGNTYLVFLSKSRSTGSLPLPGVLERVADRVSKVIQNSLWDETNKRADRRLPDCVTSMPTVSVGFSGIVHNPCLDPMELISSALDRSAQVARTQMLRLKDRQKEMMQTLIQSDHLLYPNYQAVFQLQPLTRAQADQAAEEKSIAPLKDLIFGFESLVRVRAAEVHDLMGDQCPIIDSRFMRPDVLFALAKEAKVSLELDQACLNHAINHSAGLPGSLMVNILPRNLHFVDYLTELFRGRENIILEISESENINNLALINEVRNRIEAQNIRIAADDFGKAFTGLDRVIKIQPHLIKFDRSLIMNIHQDEVRHSYVKGLVKAARLLNTDVLAEGVELWEEAECLQKMGINFIQGFLLHKPQPVDVILQQLSQAAPAVAKTQNKKVA